MRIHTTLKITIFAAIVTTLQSCGPNLVTAEEMKAEQEAYEKKKQEIIDSKGGYFKKNKDKIYERATQLANIFGNFSKMEVTKTDSLYVHPKPIKIQNFGTASIESLIAAAQSGVSLRNKSNEPTDMTNVAFTIKMSIPSTDSIVKNDLVDVLVKCKETNNEKPCILEEQGPIKTLMNAEYLFVEQTLLTLPPSTKSSTEFNSGISIKQLTCIDIDKAEAFYSFNVIAGNSDEITTVSYGNQPARVSQSRLDRDLEQNAVKEMNKNINKHFVLFD